MSQCESVTNSLLDYCWFEEDLRGVAKVAKRYRTEPKISNFVGCSCWGGGTGCVEIWTVSFWTLVSVRATFLMAILHFDEPHVGGFCSWSTPAWERRWACIAPWSVAWLE